jgi:CBS domain-containing protein
MTELHSTIGVLMTPDPVVIDPDDELDIAEAVMRLAGSHEWPVARGRTLLGVITLGDLLAARAPDEGAVACGRVMGRVDFAAGPEEELLQVARRMQRHRLSCLPIVRGGELLGILTLNDLLEIAVHALREEKARFGLAPLVAHLMTHTPLTISVNDRLAAARAIMERSHVRHLPVMKEGRLAGIISDRDVVSLLRVATETGEAVLAGAVMSAAPETVQPETEAAAAGHVLIRRQIGALPVVRGDRLVGIIAKRDFLDYLISLGPGTADGEPS